MKIPFGTFITRFFKSEQESVDLDKEQDGISDDALQCSLPAKWNHTYSNTSSNPVNKSEHEFDQSGLVKSAHVKKVNFSYPDNSVSTSDSLLVSVTNCSASSGTDSYSTISTVKPQTSVPSAIASSRGKRSHQARQHLWQKHIATPVAERHSFLTNLSPSFSYCVPSSNMHKCDKSWTPSMVATPLVLSSLHSLHSVPTPSDAFSDLLQIIDQESTAKQREQNAEHSQKAYTEHTKSDESEFLEMLIKVAEKVQSEKASAAQQFTYTRPEDELKFRRSGQRKCKHAKRMTEMEEQYMKQHRQEKRKELLEKRKRKLLPREGVRRSLRLETTVKYY